MKWEWQNDRRAMSQEHGGLRPHGTSLRQALQWMSDEGRHDAAAIEEASRRFDLTPLEEEFLLRELARSRDERKR